MGAGTSPVSRRSTKPDWLDAEPPGGSQPAQYPNGGVVTVPVSQLSPKLRWLVGALKTMRPIAEKLAPVAAEAFRRDRQQRTCARRAVTTGGSIGRRLDRRLACPRPRSRAVVRASSKGGDSGDSDCSEGDEDPPARPLLLLVDERHGRVNLRTLRTSRAVVV
jgi:hypothetical protein